MAADDRDEGQREGLRQLALGFIPAQLVHVAARLGVADALADGPREVPALAAAMDADPDSLARLLRALRVIGIVTEPEPRVVALTDLGQPLRADHPASLRSMILLYGDEATWRAWGALTHSVRTGETAFDHVHDEPAFDHFARHPALSRTFNDAMVEGTRRIAPAVAEVHEFSRHRVVMDVGGGRGTLLAAILQATPTLRGVLFDTPEGAASAADLLTDAGVAERCRIETGDFFERVPDGADCHVLKSVIHDWDDQRSTTILDNCRWALPDDGRLLLVEPVLPERVEEPEAAGIVMSDINMLVNTGGRERTEEEFASLLRGAGLELVGVSPPLPGSQLRVLEAAVV